MRTHQSQWDELAVRCFALSENTCISIAEACCPPVRSWACYVRRSRAPPPPQPGQYLEMTDDTPSAVDAEARRAALIHDLRARLGTVCADWPAEMFTSMIEGLANITMRYNGGNIPSTYDRRSSDRLVADMKDAIERNAIARRNRESGEHREPPETD